MTLATITKSSNLRNTDVTKNAENPRSLGFRIGSFLLTSFELLIRAANHWSAVVSVKLFMKLRFFFDRFVFICVSLQCVWRRTTRFRSFNLSPCSKRLLTNWLSGVNIHWCFLPDCHTQYLTICPFLGWWMNYEIEEYILGLAAFEKLARDRPIFKNVRDDIKQCCK